MSSNPKKVLLVEDDDTLRENYSSLLEFNRLNVTSCSNKIDAIDFIDKNIYDIVILDVTLNDNFEAGFEICQHIRSKNAEVPIIFLTERDEDYDRISGLRLGADDYLSKTISAGYLAARITALLRRIDILTNKTKSEDDSKEIILGKLKIDFGTSQAYWGNQPVNISLTQFWILSDLASHTGVVRTTDDLMNSAKITVQPNTIVVHIKSIRDAIIKLDPEFSCIRSERARGYRWVHDS